MSRNLRVLLAEPWFAGSHRAWAEGLARHSTHRISLVTHPGAFWKWRMQGAALTLAEGINADVAVAGPPDVLVVSDLVHVPALLGLARRALHSVPVVLYVHENQLTYPDNTDGPAAAGRGARPHRAADLTYPMINWLSMAAADAVVFNSDHHRRAWFDALPAFLARFPDEGHRHRIDEVRARTSVLPVGVDPPTGCAPREDARPPAVLWNHRWEWDKDPDAFVDALIEVAGRGVDFEVILAGERPQQEPDALLRARQRLADRVIHCGNADPERYRQLLARADVVVSTARHEFFGVAVVEAIAAGALPLLPDRLAYPELVPGADPYLYRDRVELVDRLTRALTDHDHRRSAAARAGRHVERFQWPRVAPAYDALLSELVDRAADREYQAAIRTFDPKA